MISAFSKAVGREIPYRFTERRPGDVAVLQARPDLANKELQWHAERGLDQMCSDLWNWQSKNPNGYD
jgi:UDP-glucose 4-epimerase